LVDELAGRPTPSLSDPVFSSS